MIGLGTATATKKGGGSLDLSDRRDLPRPNGQVTERWAFSDDTKAITDFFG